MIGLCCDDVITQLLLLRCHGKLELCGSGLILPEVSVSGGNKVMEVFQQQHSGRLQSLERSSAAAAHWRLFFFFRGPASVNTSGAVCKKKKRVNTGAANILACDCIFDLF